MSYHNPFGFGLSGKPETRTFDAATGVWSVPKPQAKAEPWQGGIQGSHPTIEREANARDESRMLAAMNQARVEAEKAGPEMQEAGIWLRSKSYPRALAELKAENLRLIARLARIEKMLLDVDMLKE